MPKRIYNHIYRCSMDPICPGGTTYNKTLFSKHIFEKHMCEYCKNKDDSECVCEPEDKYCWKCDELHEVCMCGDYNKCHKCKKFVDKCICERNQ